MTNPESLIQRVPGCSIKTMGKNWYNEELDIEQTIKTSANSGYLEIKQKNVENQIKFLLF